MYLEAVKRVKKRGHLSDPLALFETTSAYSLVVIRYGNIISLFSLMCNREVMA